MAIIKASYHEMLRIALNRHRWAHYRSHGGQRKQGLLTQLAL